MSLATKWEELLPELQFSYNTATHSTNKFSPFTAATGRRPTLPSSLLLWEDQPLYAESMDCVIFHNLAQMHSRIRKEQKHSFETNKKYFDQRAKAKVFHPGDRVFITRPHKGTLCQKFQPKYEGTFTIIEDRENGNWLLQKENGGRTTVIHANRIKPMPFLTQKFARATGEHEEVERENREAESDEEQVEEDHMQIYGHPEETQNENEQHFHPEQINSDRESEEESSENESERLADGSEAQSSSEEYNTPEEAQEPDRLVDEESPRQPNALSPREQRYKQKLLRDKDEERAKRKEKEKFPTVELQKRMTRSVARTIGIELDDFPLPKGSIEKAARKKAKAEAQK